MTKDRDEILALYLRYMITYHTVTYPAGHLDQRQRGTLSPVLETYIYVLQSYIPRPTSKQVCVNDHK